MGDCVLKERLQRGQFSAESNKGVRQTIIALARPFGALGKTIFRGSHKCPNLPEVCPQQESERVRGSVGVLYDPDGYLFR